MFRSGIHRAHRPQHRAMRAGLRPVRQAVLQGLPGEYGCRAFLFVPPAYMLPGERLLRMLGMPAFSLRGGHVFLCAEQQQTPYRLCALRAGGRRRRACVVSGRQ